MTQKEMYREALERCLINIDRQAPNAEIRNIRIVPTNVPVPVGSRPKKAVLAMATLRYVVTGEVNEDGFVPVDDREKYAVRT